MSTDPIECPECGTEMIWIENLTFVPIKKKIGNIDQSMEMEIEKAHYCGQCTHVIKRTYTGPHASIIGDKMEEQQRLNEDEEEQPEEPEETPPEQPEQPPQEGPIPPPPPPPEWPNPFEAFAQGFQSMERMARDALQAVTAATMAGQQGLTTMAIMASQTVGNQAQKVADVATAASDIMSEDEGVDWVELSHLKGTLRKWGMMIELEPSINQIKLAPEAEFIADSISQLEQQTLPPGLPGQIRDYFFNSILPSIESVIGPELDSDSDDDLSRSEEE